MTWYFIVFGKYLVVPIHHPSLPVFVHHTGNHNNGGRRGNLYYFDCRLSLPEQEFVSQA